MFKKVHHIFFALILAGFATSMHAQEASSPNQSTSCPLYVPKAFTPNGDDLNETFLIRQSETCPVEFYQITIFDRWGQVVFESNSLQEGDAWNGQVNGNSARAGVYMYKISAKMRSVNNREKLVIKNLQGSLVLLR